MRVVSRGLKAAAMVLAAAALAAPAVAAHAASKASDKKRAAVLQAIVDCRAMGDQSARLACYDAAAAKLDEAEASGQVVVVDREQARQVRKEVFGLQLPSLDVFNLGGGGKAAEAVAAADDVDRIVSAAKGARRMPDGKWMVELESGAVWRQIDTAELALDPHQGSKVEIRKGTVGSFFMKVDGQPAIRAHRDR